jgi:hypothetical protein
VWHRVGSVPDGSRGNPVAERCSACGNVVGSWGLPQRYNIRVAAPDPKPDHSSKHHRHAIYATETTGLLLIAFLLLALTLIRYWHDIHWSLR